MRLDDEVQGADVEKAPWLFKASTMAANAMDQQFTSTSGNTVTMENSCKMSSVTPTRAELQQTEAFVLARVAIGTVVNKC